MKDVYEQVYYQPNPIQVQDHHPGNSSKKSNGSSSSGSTVLGRFLKLGKSKSDAHGSGGSNNAANLKRRHAPNNSNEFEDDFRLTPSQLRGVERMVHKANMRKDVSRSHSWIFGSVKLPSDMPPGYGYDAASVAASGYGHVGRGNIASIFENPTSPTPGSEYATPTHNSNMQHIPRCQTAAEDFCCSCEYQDDFNFLAGTPSGTSGPCKACCNNMFTLEAAKYNLKNGGDGSNMVVGGNRKFEQESGKKFASSVRKLTWKSLKQAVKKRPSLDSLKAKPMTGDWLDNNSGGLVAVGPGSKEIASYSNEDLLGAGSSGSGPTNYFFPDKKNGFYASCTDLNSESGGVSGQNITATASVRVRPKRSRQSWHFPNEFGPVPNYQEEDTAMYHSEWDLRQYLPMPYEEWLNSTSPSSATASTQNTQAKNPMSDFDACFEPPTSVKVSVNNHNESRAKGRPVSSRGSSNNNNNSHSPTRITTSSKVNGGNQSHKGVPSMGADPNATDLYSNGGVKRFSILYTEATAYQLNRASTGHEEDENENDQEDDEDGEDDYGESDGRSSSLMGDSDQVRIAGQGIFMMAGNSNVTVARSNSNSSERYANKPNFSKSNHPHHLMLTSSDEGVWSDTQTQTQNKYSNSHTNRDRVQLMVPNKGMGVNNNINGHTEQHYQQSMSFTSFQQQQSTFSHYAAPGPSSNGSNSSGSSSHSNSNGMSRIMTDGNGSTSSQPKKSSNSGSGSSPNYSMSTSSQIRNSNLNMYESDSLTHVSVNNNNYHQSEMKNRAGTPHHQQHQRRDNIHSEEDLNTKPSSHRSSGSNSKNLQFNGESGKSSGKEGNKYGALRRRKGGRSSSSPGKNLLRETIYEEESEHAEADGITTETTEAETGDKELSYSVKIVVSQNGSGDYVKPILKNRGHYATPNVSSSFYENSAEVMYNQQQQWDQQSQNGNNTSSQSQNSDSNGSAGRTRKKVQFNSEQVIVCGGLSEPELEFEDEEVPSSSCREPDTSQTPLSQESSSFHVVGPNSNNTTSGTGNSVKPAAEISIGMTESSSSSATMMEKTRQNSNNGINIKSEDDEIVQVSRGRMKPVVIASQVNNLQQQQPNNLSKLNTTMTSSNAAVMRPRENESIIHERTSSKKNTTAVATANANSNVAGMTTTTNATMNLNHSLPSTIKTETQTMTTAITAPTTVPATQLKRTSDEEIRSVGIAGTRDFASAIVAERERLKKTTPHGSSASMKAERIGAGATNKEQAAISKVKGCQPQKILNPNSLLFNDTTRIRLNQARPSLEHTFKLNFDSSSDQRSESSKSSKTSATTFGSSHQRRVRTSHSFRGASQMMQIPLRPKEPPPPPPVPHRVLPPIPTTENEHHYQKSNQISNGYGPGLGLGHSAPTRTAPTNKSQISLPMPMLGFSTTNNNVSNGKSLGTTSATATADQRHTNPSGTKPMQQNRNSGSSKSSALVQKCEAIEKVLSQKLEQRPPAPAPVPTNSTTKTSSSHSKTPTATKTNGSTSSQENRNRANNSNMKSGPAATTTTSRQNSHTRETPPPRPPPISPKPVALLESDYKLNKQSSKQGNSNRTSAAVPANYVPPVPERQTPPTPAGAPIKNNNTNRIDYQTPNSGEPVAQNIEIVTRENSVSEIRIYSGTTNMGENDVAGESQSFDGKMVPNKSQPNEIHYAATDLFQKDGSFNFSSTSLNAKDQPQEYCQSSASSSASSDTTLTCSRPQSTSVVLIIDTGSSEAEVANSISKAMKPSSCQKSQSQSQGQMTIDPLPPQPPQTATPLPVAKQETLPMRMTMTSQTRIEGKGVGQQQEEDEPVYDDVINHSATVTANQNAYTPAPTLEKTTENLNSLSFISPPTSPPPVPPSPPPPLDDDADNLYSDIGRDEDEDSGTCLLLGQESPLTQDIIYDDTQSVISNNYEGDLLKINNKNKGSESSNSTSGIRSSAVLTRTKAKTKFSPVINHPKPIKTQQQPPPPTSSSSMEDEPMYDDVLNLISAVSDIESTVGTKSQSQDSDSGTETDSPPPLPSTGPPLHLLPKISMELPLIPLPYLNNKKILSGEKSAAKDVAKGKSKMLGNSTKSSVDILKEKKAAHALAEILKASCSTSAKNEESDAEGGTTKESDMTVSIQNCKSDASHDEDDVLDRTRTLLNELNDKLSKLSFQPDYSSYVSKVVISSSSESSGVEEDYNSEKNYSLSNGSDAASSGDDNYKLSAVSKLVTETISMARGKFLDSMKLNMLNGQNQNDGGTPSPVSDDTEEPIYEEINEGNGNSSGNVIRGTSPIYSDAFDAKSIFDGASRNEILSFLESIRDRLTNGTTESNSESRESSLTKKTRKFGEIERNDSGIGSESGSLVAITGGRNILVESLCADCNEAPVDPRITTSTLDAGESCSSEVLGGAGMNRLELCRSCSRKRSERKEIILEIYETEMKYGRDLRIVADEFYNPIQVAGLLTKEQLDQIFLNVTQLIEMNSELTGLLKTAIDEAIAAQDEDLNTVTIGRIFLEIGEKMMSAFESYCTRQANAGALLTQLEKERELLRIFLRVSQMENAVLRRMNLPAFLMVPVQRVTRYPLLLSRLLKVTCADHSSRDELQLAQEKIEQHLEHMNKTTREVASVKLWRRISIINNNSPVHRRSSNDMDGANIRIRKMAFDVLDWANFTDVTCVIENQLNIVNLNGKSLRNIYGCLLARGKDLDNLALKMDQDIFFPPVDDVVKEVKLVLVRVKNTRFCLLREPLCLSKCVVSQGENEFQDFIEINEITTKNTYYLQAMDKQGTSVWLRLLQCHAVCVGQWRRRRGALANIMMNGMIRHL